MCYIITHCGDGWEEKLELVVVATIHQTLNLSEMIERGAVSECMLG